MSDASLLEALHAARRAGPLWRFPEDTAALDTHTENPLFEPAAGPQAAAAPPGQASVPLWCSGLVHPHSPWKRRWDAAMRCLVIYCILIIPWNVGYTFDLLERVCRSPTPLDNCFPAYMGTLDTLVGVLFWLDVGLSLRTALVNPDGRLVLDARRIVDASARGWLAYDLASIVPWDALVVCAYAAASMAPSTLALKVAKVPRLLRVRLLRPLLRAASALPLGRLAQLLCGFLVLAHWGACAMWTISRWQVEHSPECGVNPDTGLLPMALVDQRRGVTYTPQADAHQAALCASRTLPGLLLPAGSEWTLYCADLRTKYIAMAYYTLTTVVTVGYGDITPGTNMERLGAICLELLGCISYAVVFGNMAVLLQAFDLAGQRLAARLAALRKLCAHYRVPRPLAKRAERHISQLWLFSRGQDMRSVLVALPEPLHAEVMTHVRGRSLLSCPLFADCPPAMMRDLAQCLQPQACTQGDDLMRSGATCAPAALVFIELGTARILSAGTKAIIGSICEGGVAGTEALFQPDAGRLFDVQAQGNCHVHVLPRPAFEAVLARFPEVQPLLYSRARQAALQLMTALTQANGAPGGASEDEVPGFGVLDTAAHPYLLPCGPAGDKPDRMLLRKLHAWQRAAAGRSRVINKRVDGAVLAYTQLDERLSRALDAKQQGRIK